MDRHGDGTGGLLGPRPARGAEDAGRLRGDADAAGHRILARAASGEGSAPDFEHATGYRYSDHCRFVFGMWQLIDSFKFAL